MRSSDTDTMRGSAQGVADRRATTRGRARTIAMTAVVLLLTALPSEATPRLTVDLQILGFSDWHGQLDPVSGAGGAAVLSSYFDRDRLANPNTLTLTAGDDFGASPPLSGFFDEEPAVKAQNLMGVSAGTLGNHNFDRGVAHLQQMIDLAAYPYLSANLTGLEGNLEGVRPWVIQSIGGVDVGIVGITNPDAPDLLFPGRMGTIHVTDPVAAANKARAQAQAAGAEVTVAIAHMGITGFDATGAPTGPLVDFAQNVGGFDVILGDHTNVQWSGIINDHLVIENRSKGVSYSRTTLSVDPLNGRIARVSTTFVDPVASGVAPDEDIVRMLAPYRSALRAALDARIGIATNVFPRAGNIERLGEVALGNLVADSMRRRYGTQLALTNGGGLRAPVPSSYLPADTSLRRTTAGYASGPPYDLVAGDVYTVLPFGNVVVTRTVTGAQLRSALTNGIASLPAAAGKFPQISGFRFTYRQTSPATVLDIELDGGIPVVDDGIYTLATNDFMNAGGDGYSMLADGKGTTRETMAQVLHQHILDEGVLTPSIDGRIARLS